MRSTVWPDCAALPLSAAASSLSLGGRQRAPLGVGVTALRRIIWVVSLGGGGCSGPCMSASALGVRSRIPGRGTVRDGYSGSPSLLSHMSDTVRSLLPEVASMAAYLYYYIKKYNISQLQQG